MTSSSSTNLSPASITALLRATLSVQVADDDTDLFGSGLLDSLGLIDLFLALEEAYGINIVVDEVDLDDFRSVTSIVRYVERQRSL